MISVSITATCDRCGHVTEALGEKLVPQTWSALEVLPGGRQIMSNGEVSLLCDDCTASFARFMAKIQVPTISVTPPEPVAAAPNPMQAVVNSNTVGAPSSFVEPDPGDDPVPVPVPEVVAPLPDPAPADPATDAPA